MSASPLRTPVALIVFNRPDTTERVFAAVARARPAKLLIISDGPRSKKPGEAERVAASRSVIDRVDWDCEILTDFSDTNLGCKRRVSSGIDWVFQQVEEAIILEDDCLPDPTFFRFCEETLERYRDDLRVGMISGNNFQGGARRNHDSYYFSRYPHIWGWATWRSRWSAQYDVSMAKWPALRNEGWLEDICENRAEAKHWARLFDRASRGKIDTWDYQWVFTMFRQRWLSVVPNVNLVSNIGFGPGATHTILDSKVANMPCSPLSFPMQHPVNVVCNRRFDRREFEDAMSAATYGRALAALSYLRMRVEQAGARWLRPSR